jgi:hypothetical protein
MAGHLHYLPPERAKDAMQANRDTEEKDRRGKMRFPLQRELRYKLVEEADVIETGAGYTLDISSGGVAFCADGVLKPGAFIELSISWPVLLEERCPMRLIIFGRVLRNLGRFAACTVDRYEFRTQARTVTNFRARQDSMLERWADSWMKETSKMQAATL